MCPCRVNTRSYVYLGWTFDESYYMVAGVDQNDDRLSGDIATDVGVTLDAGFFAFMAQLAGNIPAAPNVNESGALANQDYNFDHMSRNETLNAYRLREGIERFYITDINNPAASAEAQSAISIQFDIVDMDASDFNHVPGGANVLYLDGHVEFLRYPSDHPVCRAFAAITWIADHM